MAEIDFDVKKLLGQGGYAFIFLGSWNEKTVAVKRVQLMDVENCKPGEEGLRSLNHENIIKLYHSEDDNYFRYYALELCKASLDKLYLKDGDLNKYYGPVPPLHEMFLQLAKGLECIHANNLVHRDLKPENALIWVQDEQQVLMKWADFGLCKSTTDKGSFSMSSNIRGTLNWLAPEILERINNQSNPNEIPRGSNKSDMFAEGLVFAYILLGGHHPYGETTAILYNLTKNNPVNLKNILAKHQRLVEEVIKKLLVTKEDDRLNAKQVVECLESQVLQQPSDLKNNAQSNQENLKFEIEVPLDQNNRVFRGKFKGNPVAIKEFLSDSVTDYEWENVIKLKNENIVTYHLCAIKDSIRFLIMDLCLGSMLAYCQDKLPDVKDLDISRMMWETASGLEYLHSEKVIHGCLVLDKILLWRKRPKSNPIVKLTGQIPISYHGGNEPGTEDDLKALGQVFYSMATNNVDEPVQFPILPKHLTEIDKSKRQSASKLIDLLLMPDSPSSVKLTSVNVLLRHPFFTINFEMARSLLMSDNLVGDVEELQKWYEESLANNTDIDEDDFNDLKQILETAETIPEILNRAFKEDCAVTFSEFIWHLYKPQQLEMNEIKFIKEKIIGSGGYAQVYSGKFCDKRGNEIPAAFKVLKREIDCELDREIHVLRQLDNLFVVKCFGSCKTDEFEKGIVMELCDGTLEDYVLGKLETIPNNSLNDKILLGQVTLGLAYIHSKRMIHKDLKPANILIWKSSSTSNFVLAKIADFGFAKQLKPNQEQFSKTLHPGSRSFMAPELLNKLATRDDSYQATYETDTYSLGIIIGVTVLKGRHPFENRVLQPLLMSAGCDPILSEELEWDVTDLILRLTKREPIERPSVTMVIYHPYFALTNDNTKAHFAEKMNNYFQLFKSPTLTYFKCFDEKNIQTWMDTVKKQKESDGNLRAIKILRQFDNALTEEVVRKLENSTITSFMKKKKTITYSLTGAEDDIYKSLDQNKNYLSELIRELISTAPELFSTFIWELISDKTGVSPFIPTDEKPSKIQVLETLKVTEGSFACLYLEQFEDLLTVFFQLENIKNDKEIHLIIRQLPRYAVPERLIQILCKKLQDINYVDSNHGTILCWALEYRWCENISIVKCILENGADPNLPGASEGKTAIHLAAENKSTSGCEILQLLLSNNGNPNVKDLRGITPVYLAAENESSVGPAILEMLLTRGGDPNAADEDKETPLHWAAMNDSTSGPEIVKLLLEHGANPTAKTKGNKTPVDLAAENKSSSGPEILKLLEEHLKLTPA